MSAAAHTPGPWAYRETGYSSHPWYVYTESERRGGPRIHGSAGAIAKLPPSKFHAQAANARLIAAAPDLLAELQLAHVIITTLQNMIPAEGKAAMAEALYKLHDGEGAVRYHERAAAMSRATGSEVTP